MKPIAHFVSSPGFSAAHLQNLQASGIVPAHPGSTLPPAELAANAPLLICAENFAAAQSLIAEHAPADNAVSSRYLVLFEGATAAERVEAIRAGAIDAMVAPWSNDEIRLKLERAAGTMEMFGETTLLRQHIYKLSQYFSNDVVQKILGQSGEHHAYGENLEATIFFLDVRNFTALSETMEPNLVAALLNRLYTDIMDLILTFKGSVNKIIGDALLATFGCPVRGENDARNAVECALAIRDTLKFFNETRPDYLKTEISVGMGIATGPVFAGTIGSYRKMDYTVIGDTVNIASRLEGLTKKTKFDLIVDRKTRDLAGADVKVRRLQVTRVRGRTQPMEIFLVDGFKEAESAHTDAIFFPKN